MVVIKEKIIHVLLAVTVLMACFANASVIAVAANTAIDDANIVDITYADGANQGETARLRTAGTKVNLELTYTQIIDSQETSPFKDIGLEVPNSGFSAFGISGGFVESDSDKAKKSLWIDSVTTQSNGDTEISFRLYVDNVRYDGNKTFRITYSLKDYAYSATLFPLNIPDDYRYSTSSGGSTNSGTVTDKLTSDIVVENVIVTDTTGERIDRITKDSPPFNITVVFADYGLKELNEDDFKYTDMEVFLASAGGFVPSNGNRGTIKSSLSTSTDAPRFRAEFRNLIWDGGGNSISVQVRYNIDGQDVTGNLPSTVVYQAKAQAEGEEGKIPPPTPYIIVNRYSYGAGQIEAGSDFKLDLSFKNTSSEIPLENIVMTITTPEDLSIATASNTYYIDSLAAGASMDYSIELEAKPSARVGSQSVQVAFTYQYLLEKERKESKTTESIAIPVTQIDRFELDPITEVPSGLIGEAAYISVSFINRGKSTTYNISGMARSQGAEIIAPAEHYGNLEPGKSDSIDVTIIPQTQGELFGEIVIQYEDENTNQKEISVPFTMYVDAPYIPEPPTYPDNEMGMTEPPEENKIPTIIFCSIGGILMAVPIALYLIKRVKAKGAEDFDEDI